MNVNTIQKKEHYQSIFLDDDWAHQKYYGWPVFKKTSKFKILHKKQGFFNRFIILLYAINEKINEKDLFSSISSAIGHHSTLGTSEIIIHDFNHVLNGHTKISGITFSKAMTQQRRLNIATFAIDLTHSVDQLYKKLGSNRNRIRKAEAEELRFVINTEEYDVIERFSQFYDDLVQKFGLKKPDLNALQRMLDDGSAITASCFDKDGNVILLLFIYLTKHKAVCLCGGAAKQQPKGAGQFVQWELILYLKSKGFKWYDMGGVQPKEHADGIYHFKKSLGGDYVDLGNEYIFQGGLFKIAAKSHHFIQAKYNTFLS